MTEQNFSEMRRAMVASQLRTTGVGDPRVIAAMGEVPRERFVPAGRISVAYADAPVPLGGGRGLNPPMTIGKLLSALRPQPGETALVVGAATGYAAAIMARLAGEVIALEEDDGLAAIGRDALAGSGVELIEGPLAEGHAARAPYDLILIDGAVEYVPEALVAQLTDGGRLAAAVLDEGVARLSIGRRAGDGFGMIAFADAVAAILPGFAKPRTFNF